MGDGRIQRGIQEIRRIRKDELSEREFYTRIMDAISRMGDNQELTEEESHGIYQALVDIGCKTYEDWKNDEILKKGRDITEIEREVQGLEYGTIGSAVNMINQFLFDNRRSSEFALDKINEGYQYSWSYMWLQASKRQLNMDKYNRKKREDLERELKGLVEEDKNKDKEREGKKDIGDIEKNDKK